MWGYFNPFVARFRQGNIPIDKIYSKLICEKLHIKFCKFVLGVHKKSSNFAVLSELGRFPLYYDVIKQTMRFWHRLENLGSNFPLLAYTSSRTLHESKQPSWFGSVQYISENMTGLKEFLHTSSSTFKNQCNKTVKIHFTDMWSMQHTTHKVGKLRTYTTFKSIFGFENYLSLVRNFEQRRCLTKLRISAHKLQIEAGRYQGTPCHNRICPKCPSGEVEDEIHFSLSVMHMQITEI